MKIAQAIVEDIMEELMSRYGFWIFLFHAPEEQQAEIRQKLIQIVIEHLSGER